MTHTRFLLINLVLILTILLSAYAPAQAQPLTLTVMAAASLTEAFGELGELFEAQHPGVTVQFNFAGSQQLVQQLNQGAQADVFASANQKQMDAAVETGRIKKAAVEQFVRNRLVVIFPKDNPAGLQSLADLSRGGLKIILAAKEVPRWASTASISSPKPLPVGWAGDIRTRCWQTWCRTKTMPVRC